MAAGTCVSHEASVICTHSEHGIGLQLCAHASSGSQLREVLAGKSQASRVTGAVPQQKAREVCLPNQAAQARNEVERSHSLAPELLSCQGGGKGGDSGFGGGGGGGGKARQASNQCGSSLPVTPFVKALFCGRLMHVRAASKAARTASPSLFELLISCWTVLQRKIV